MDACLSFDDILTSIGEFGFYQKRLVVYMFPFGFLYSFLYLAQIFIILRPTYWCRIPELLDQPKDLQLSLGIPKKDNTHYERCVMYDTNFTEALANNLQTANTSWPQKSCDSWVYDRKEVPYESIATKENWVCEDDNLGPSSVLIFFLGAILGSVLFGYAIDNLGRLPTAVISNACGLIGGVASAFCSHFLWFAVSRFIAGMAFDTSINAIWILALEYMGAKYRPLVTNITISAYFVFGASLLPWIALWCNNWRLFALVTSVPLLINVLLYFVIQESARWLISVGKIDKAILIIKDVAKKNGKTIADGQLLAAKNCWQTLYENKNIRYTYLDLFKNRQMLFITTFSTLLWMISVLEYDCHLRTILLYGTNVFITFTISLMTELPACLLPILFVNIIGRKCMCFIALFVCTLGSFAAAVLEEELLVIGLAVVCRFCTTVTFNVAIQWGAEMLPTVIRGQGISFIHTSGFVALLLSPFIVYTEKYSESLPLVILGCLSALAASCCLLLPETNNRELPEVPEDVKNIMKNQRLCSCLENKS